MRAWISVASAVLISLGACGNAKDRSTPAAKDGAARAAAATRDGGAPPAGDAGAKRVAVLPRDQVDALMKTWLEAQNAGDFAAYSALYADDFAGVRRSGKQTVRLDRKGWLGDRKKMFTKPMLVGMREVVVVLAPARAIVHFTQEWASGSYHDVGPKVIEVVARGADLAIAREEMLVSRLVTPTRVAGMPPVLPVIQQMIVLAAAEPDWLGGKPRLEAGSMPDRDPGCDDDPPDYEQDQTRYWECQASDPQRGSASFVVTADPARTALPPELAAWVGREVRMVAAGTECTAKVTRLELHAERETTFAQVTEKGTDDASIAEAVYATGAPVLVALVDAGCAARYAQLAGAPAAVPWRIADAPPALADKVRARMVAAGLDDGHAEEVEVQTVTGPTGKVLAVASWAEDVCEPLGLHVVYPVKGQGVAGDPLLDDHEPGGLVAAVDADGDGWPELVFDDGVAVRDRASGVYQRDRLVRFPDEIADCGD